MMNTVFMASTSLFSAFAGAWAAFKLQNYQNGKKERKHSIVSLQKALFAIGSQYNEIKIIYNQFLKTEEGDKRRHIKIIPIGNYSKIPELDIDSLSFIFGSGETDIVFELMLAQNSYFSFLGMLEKRNEYYSELQDLAGDLGEDAIDKLGLEGMTQKYPKILCALEKATDELYELYTHTIKINRKSSGRLTTFFRKSFKDVNPMEFVPLENEKTEG